MIDLWKAPCTGLITPPDAGESSPRPSGKRAPDYGGRRGIHGREGLGHRFAALSVHRICQGLNMRKDSELAEAGLTGQSDHMLRRHVLFIDAVAFHGMLGHGGGVVAASRLRCEANSARFERVIRLAERESFVVGMVQGIEEYRTVELAPNRKRFIVAANKRQVTQTRPIPALLRESDHARSNVNSNHVIAGAGRELAGPAGAATEVEQSRRRGRQQSKQSSQLQQVAPAIGIGERFIDRVPNLMFRQAAYISHLILLCHRFTLCWSWFSTEQ